MLVDSHCHPDDTQFDSDRTEMLRRAQEAGVQYLLAIGTGNGPPDLEAAVRLAEGDTRNFIYATVGVHPNDVAKIDSRTFEHLTGLLRHPKVKAVGEIGLDYHWETPRELQTPAFVRQLELASEAGLPIVIHTRDAWNETIEILKAHSAEYDLSGVMHCFTGTVDQAKECLDLGLYLSFGGVATFPKAVEVREAARAIPLERLLLETDAPYLAPVPFRGKRNEPAYVVHTARYIAELRGLTIEELGHHTTINFKKLFRVADIHVE